MTFHGFPSYCDVVRGKYGLYLVNPQDQYVGQSLIQYGEFSDGEVTVFDHFLKAGDAVLEIGSNIGALTLPLARLVGPRGLVIAVEPQRLLHQMLAGMLAVNGITNTYAVWAACGDATRSFIHVPRAEPTLPNNFGGIELIGDVPSGELVWCPTVHDLLYTLDITHPIDLLKIDAEGMEPMILTGADSLFRAQRPVAYVESDRPHNTDTILAHFAGHQYDCWWHLPPLFNPDNFNKKTENLFGRIVSGNLICVPQERGWIPPEDWGCTNAKDGNPTFS